MKPAKGVDVTEEIAEVHTSARSPSPKQRNKPRSRSRSGPRKSSSGHTSETEAKDTPLEDESPTGRLKTRENWIGSQQNESVDMELPIHDQIKQDILGFVEKEFKSIDGTGKSPSFVFYSHDPNGLDEKYMKSLSRPSSGYKEKRSPSYRKKKRHLSKHRDRELQEFELPGSSLSALERVDDYLKEYNKDEVVTLSGELEIEHNDADNNNGSAKELQYKPRKTRRKTRDERQDSNANGREVSPKVFKSALKSRNVAKPARPKDITAMLESLEANRQFSDQYIDNPFSSPSPVTSPNDERLGPYQRPERVYLQGGGTFQAASRDRILSDANRDDDEDKYFRLGEHTPLDIAILVQKAWRGCALACHGVLGGLSLLHLLLISCSDSLDAGHLSFHALVTMPYVAAYYFFCVLCLLSVLDSLDPESLLPARAGLQRHFPRAVLGVLHAACLLLCAAARPHDELMMYQYTGLVESATANYTTPTIPEFYHTWAHLSIWRGVLALLGLVYCLATSPKDMLLKNLQDLRPVRQPN